MNELLILIMYVLLLLYVSKKSCIIFIITRYMKMDKTLKHTDFFLEILFLI